jgi:hypothetical protein
LSPALRLLSILLLASLTAACDTPPSREPFPKLTYGYLTPFRLAVGRIEIVDAYRSVSTLPHVEQGFPVSPADSAAEWGRGRLVAAGGPGHAVFTVLRADAIETLPAQADGGGIFSGFDAPPSDRYDLTIAVRLQIVEAGGKVVASLDAKAARSVTIADDATLNDRERAWFALTEQTMKDLNAALEKSIPHYLRGYLR